MEPSPTVRAVAGDGSVTLTWTDAADGPRPDQYRVYQDRAWVATVGDDEAATTRLTVPQLANGITHAFQVSARRDGRWSALSTPAAATPSPPHGLLDLPADEAVAWLMAPGSDPGRPIGGHLADRRFRPLLPVTRGQAARTVYRYAQEPAVDSLPPHGLVDVPAALEGAVRHLVQDPDGDGPRRPMLSGLGDRRFRPNRLLTRGQWAMILHGLAGSPESSGGDPEYVDVRDSSSTAVGWAVAIGALAPVTVRRFVPQLPVTRRGLARGLYRTDTWRAEQATTRLPDDLWQPPADALPASGNYLYVQAIDGWASTPDGLRTPRDARLTIESARTSGRITLVANGDDRWSLWLALADGADLDHVGLIDDLGYHTGVSHLGNECGMPALGWLAVDHVRWKPDGTLDELDYRLEYRCGGIQIHAAVRYDSDDPLFDPPPPAAVPGDLWSPAPGTTPATGNWIRMESHGRALGNGSSATYTAASRLSVGVSGPRIRAAVAGAGNWTIDASAPIRDGAPIPTGYYTDTVRPTLGNPARAGLQLSYDYRTCWDGGWLAIDHIAYAADGTLAELDLRFELRCQSTPGDVVNGAIHYDVDDPVFVPATPRPIPPDLWGPAPGSTPTEGNWVQLQGTNHTSPSSQLAVGRTNDVIEVQVTGTTPILGRFAVSGGATPAVGYYDQLRPHPGHDPVRGGIYVHTPRCSTQMGGWFAIDHLVLTPSGTVAELDLRFSTDCVGVGAVHFRAA
ncbi:MAG: fibronectin type III domain-containing protein [Acidimicrobiales bacterium]|nr:fibronectin type III domain-containing protein [Acidimicrobiales bacterium]